MTRLYRPHSTLPPAPEPSMTLLGALELDAPLPELARPACADYADPDAFFPSSGDPGYAAKRVCAFCPERQACLEYALANEGAAWGVWGGLTAQERRRLKSAA